MTKKVDHEIEKVIEDLTPKQAKFFALWLKTGNGTKSAMEAYETDNPNVAGVYASNTLRNIKNPMKLFLESRGVGIDKLFQVIDDALKAEKTDITGDKHPDHKIRLEASDRLSKWLDVEVKEEPQIQTNVQVNIPDVFLDKYKNGNV